MAKLWRVYGGAGGQPKIVEGHNTRVVGNAPRLPALVPLASA